MINVPKDVFDKALEGISFRREDRGAISMFINDKRIPSKLLAKNYCTICCPKDLWPEKQKRKWEKQVKKGNIVESENGYSFKPYKTPWWNFIEKFKSWRLTKKSFNQVVTGYEKFKNGSYKWTLSRVCPMKFAVSAEANQI